MSQLRRFIAQWNVELSSGQCEVLGDLVVGDGDGMLVNDGLCL